MSSHWSSNADGVSERLDVESLANPAAGELTIAYPESLSVTVLPQIVERLSEKYLPVSETARIQNASLYAPSKLGSMPSWKQWKAWAGGGRPDEAR